MDLSGNTLSISFKRLIHLKITNQGLEWTFPLWLLVILSWSLSSLFSSSFPIRRFFLNLFDFISTILHPQPLNFHFLLLVFYFLVLLQNNPLHNLLSALSFWYTLASDHLFSVQFCLSFSTDQFSWNIKNGVVLFLAQVQVAGPPTYAQLRWTRLIWTTEIVAGRIGKTELFTVAFFPICEIKHGNFNGRPSWFWITTNGPCVCFGSRQSYDLMIL